MLFPLESKYRYSPAMNKLPGRTQSYPTLQRIADFFHGLGNRNVGALSRYESLELPRISPRMNINGASLADSSPLMQASKRVVSTSSPRLTSGPVMMTAPSDIREAFQMAMETGDWRWLISCYSYTFGSAQEINNAFKSMPQVKDIITSEAECGINLVFVAISYNILLQTPQEVQKAQLGAVNSCIQKMKKLGTRLTARARPAEELRACFLLLLSPLFRERTSYNVLAGLLRHMSELPRDDCRTLVQWYKSLDQESFSGLVQALNAFLSCCLSSVPDAEVPLVKSHWWVPCCCRVLAILNAANELSIPQHVHRCDFYNATLDKLSLFEDYCGWQAADVSDGIGAGTGHGVFFCQYPFLLTIQAKRFILQKDSEQQMVDQARRYLTEAASQHNRALSSLPSDVAFLNLMVRRSNLVEDTLSEIAQKKTAALRRKLRVTFVDEPGLDRGGLTKEWFMLLTREVLSPQRGTFVYDDAAGTYWFSLANDEKKLKEFHLAGVLMGLAIYNGFNLDVRFPPCVYRKLLSPAVVPYNNPRASIGVVDCTTAPLEELKRIMPSVASSLSSLLAYDGDVENDLCLTFQVSVSQHGVTHTESLKPGGDSISVTAANRREFVSLYAEWIINASVYSQFRAFYHGFHSVCASNALLLLHAEEVEVLVCGSDNLNMLELQNVTSYSGYSPTSRVIRDFWEIVNAFPAEQQKKLLLFATGSDRLPVGGMSEMKFKICRPANSKEANRLPTSQTCFNKLLLPPYKNRKIMRQKLVVAIQNAEGFWLQ